MKKEKIIIELENILNESDDFIALQNMNKLIETLKNDVLLESAKKTTKTIKINAIKRVLTDKKTINRPVLQKYDIQNNKMCFTNSYIAFRINELKNNPFIKAEDKEKYPKLDAFFNINMEQFTPVDINYSDVNANKKLKIEFTNINGENFNTNYLINLLDIMDSNTKYYIKNNDPFIYGLDEQNNEDCLILGVKTY